MKIRKLKTELPIVVFGTLLIVFLSYRYVVHVKNIEIQRAFYLFKQSMEQEKRLMQPGQMFLGDSEIGLRSDSVIIETEKENGDFNCSLPSKIPIEPLLSIVFFKNN